MVSRPLRPHRFLSGGLLLGVVGIVLALATQSASAGSNVCMGVVIDYGTNPVSSGAPKPPAPITQSASVAPDSTSDEEALVAAGDAVDPNSSGLICALNSYPGNADQNCLRSANGAFYYWSYWQGDPFTNTWTYASEGPASHTVAGGSTYVEGWRYQDPGADNPSAIKPSVSPAAGFAAACPGVTPVAKTASPSAGTTRPPAPSSPTPTSAAPSAGGPANGSNARTSSPSTSPGTSGTSGTTTTTHSGSGAAAAPSSATPGSPLSATTPTITTHFGQSRHLDRTKAALHHTSGGSGGSGGSGDGGISLPIVLVIVVVSLLGVVAAVRWRRGPAPQE